MRKGRHQRRVVNGVIHCSAVLRGLRELGHATDMLWICFFWGGGAGGIYTPSLTVIIPSIASQFYTRAEWTWEPEKIIGTKIQMLVGRSKQNTGILRPKGILDGTMTDCNRM